MPEAPMDGDDIFDDVFGDEDFADIAGDAKPVACEAKVVREEQVGEEEDHEGEEALPDFRGSIPAMEAPIPERPAGLTDEMALKLVPPGHEMKYRALLMMSNGELKRMLREMQAPLAGNREEIALRITRVLAGYPPTEADAPLFEVIESEIAARTNRVLRKAAREVRLAGRQGNARGEGVNRKGPKRIRRVKIIAQNKVGVLTKPDVATAKVDRYVQSGEVLEVSEDQVMQDGRRYWRIKQGKGWLPECSRKDATKVICEELPPPEPAGPTPEEIEAAKAKEAARAAKEAAKKAAEEAKAAAAAAAAQAMKVGDVCSVEYEGARYAAWLGRRNKEDGTFTVTYVIDESVEHYVELGRVQAPQPEDIHRAPEPPPAEGALPEAISEEPAKKRQKTDNEGLAAGEQGTGGRHAVADEQEAPEGDLKNSKDSKQPKELPPPAPADLPEGHLPKGCEGKYMALVDLETKDLKDMLRQAEVPSEGARHELAVRLLRALAELPPVPADERMFEARRRRIALEELASTPRLTKAEFEHFVEDFVKNSDLKTTSLGDMNRAIEAKFGALPPVALKKARELATKLIIRLARLQAQKEALQKKLHQQEKVRDRPPKPPKIKVNGKGRGKSRTEQLRRKWGHDDVFKPAAELLAEAEEAKKREAGQQVPEADAEAETSVQQEAEIATEAAAAPESAEQDTAEF